MLSVPLPMAAMANALPWTLDGQASIPAAQSNDWTTLATVTLSGYRGYLTAYGVTVRDAAYDFSGSLLFRIIANGAPMLDLSGQGYWSTQRGSVATPIPALIPIYANQLVSLECRRAVASAGATLVAMLATGIRYPAEVRETIVAAQQFGAYKRE